MKRKIVSLLCVMTMLFSIIPEIGLVANASGADNIAARADYLYNITWAPQSTVKGWRNNYTFSPGQSYHIPYGQPVSKGKYIGWGISVDDFLSATQDSSSAFYTLKSYYNGNSGSYSTYYAMDCSAFASYCWDLPNRTTTSSWSKLPVSSYGKCTSSNINKIQIGDALNLAGSHIVIVSDIIYSGSSISQIEITEQTPYQIRRLYYTPSELSSKYSKYTIYRYNNRNSVSPPPNSGNNPTSTLDFCEGRTASVWVSGWAFDNDDISQAIPVHVYIGGPAGDPNAEGYPITANQLREDVNAVHGCGNYHGFDAEIPTSKIGTQDVYVYACNIGNGSNQLIEQVTVNIKPPEEQPPVITNARITDITNRGYTVLCNVTDHTAVDRVQFATWSAADGQDDIAPNWHINPIVSGKKNSAGEYEFHVNISDHRADRDLYHTHIYAYDVYGNVSSVPLSVTIPGYDYCFEEITLGDNDLCIKGWAAAINDFNELKAVLTDKNGKSISYNITNRYYRSDIEAYRPDWSTTLSGFNETFDISKLAVGNVHMKVTGITDGNTFTLYDKDIQYKDIKPPVILDARIVDVTNRGYTVLCKVTDNNEVNRVQFVTWSDRDGQDDIAPDFINNPAIRGNLNSNDEYEFHVNTSEHYGDRGLYFTHIYAVDTAGNEAFVPLTAMIPGYDFNIEKVSLQDKRSLYVKGWATSINGIENMKAVITDSEGTCKSYDISNRYSRDDISNLRPGWENSQAGYKQTIDITGLMAGDAMVEITGELYQDDIEKTTYTLGKYKIKLPDDLKVNVNVDNKNKEYFVGETIKFNIDSQGAQYCRLEISNNDGLSGSFVIGKNKEYLKAFDNPGQYSVRAEAVGLEETKSSDIIYFTVLEAPELEPDIEDAPPTPTPTVTPTPKPTPTPTPTAKPNPTPTPPPTGDGAAVKVSTATASAGGTATVTVDLSGNKGFANLGLDIAYDKNVLTLTSAKNNTSVGAVYTPSQNISANPYHVGWDSTNNVTFNGTLVTLTFAVNSSAADGEYPITISYYKGNNGDYTDGTDVNYDENFNSLKLNYINGAVKVSSHLPGDINGDGKVNNQDGTFLLRHLAGWSVNVDSSALDVNGDGKVNNQDGTILLRHLAGWDITIH